MSEKNKDIMRKSDKENYYFFTSSKFWAIQILKRKNKNYKIN